MVGLQVKSESKYRMDSLKFNYFGYSFNEAQAFHYVVY